MNEWKDEERTLIETFLNGYCVGKLVQNHTAAALPTTGGGRPPTTNPPTTADKQLTAWVANRCTATAHEQRIGRTDSDYLCSQFHLPGEKERGHRQIYFSTWLLFLSIVRFCNYK